MIKPIPTYRKKYAPVPQAVVPQNWTILECSNPSVSMSDGVMKVPMSESDRDLASRYHEMIHCKISPWSKEEVNIPKSINETVSAFEDYRVHTFGSSLEVSGRELDGYYASLESGSVLRDLQNVPESVKDLQLRSMAHDLCSVLDTPQIDPVTKLRAVVSTGPLASTLIPCMIRYTYYIREEEEKRIKCATMGLSLPNEVIQSFEEYNHESLEALIERDINCVNIAQRIEKALSDAFPSRRSNIEAMEMIRRVMQEMDCLDWASVPKAARMFEREFKKLKKEEEQRQKMQEEMQKAIAEASRGMGKQDGTLSALTECGVKGLEDKLNSNHYEGRPFGRRRRPSWEGDTSTPYEAAMMGVKMDIVQCKLSVYKPQMISRKKAPEYCGAVPKHMERLPFDGQVFERKLRGRGGTTLIDISGSMSFCDATLEELVKTAPAVTVACYTGRRPAEGKLWIVSAHGRMTNVSEGLRERLGYGWNIIDTLALEWLAKQKPPRIWVSDGGITGRDHKYYKSVVQKAVILCRVHNIIRVPSVDAAINLFQNSLTFTERGRLACRPELIYDPEGIHGNGYVAGRSII